MRFPSRRLAALSSIPLASLAAISPVARAGATAAAAPVAQADAYCVVPGTPVSIAAAQGVLANDGGAPLTVVRNTAAAHGTVAVRPDGSFTYTPTAGYVGQDSFTYTVTDAVRVYRAPRTIIASFNGVDVDGDAFGSSWAAVPGSTTEFYGLTDRGPNVDGPVSNSKVFSIPSFNPAIGRFVLENGVARQTASIGLKDEAGVPLTGVVPPLGAGGTGEGSYDLNGQLIAPDPRGIDSEGLVALADGTFWVSDEYGPFITHFAANGTTIEKITPFAPNAQGHRLPQVLARRTSNRGMEGLTVTPDGTMLVGVMQAALANDITEGDAKKTPPMRIVTYNLATGATKQYLYLLDDPITTGAGASEIAALSSTEFLVIERDGKFPSEGATFKKIYRASIAGATDVSVAVNPGDTVDPVKGLLFGGTTTIETLTKKLTSAAAQTALAGKNVVPATKTLTLDLATLLTSLDPAGKFYPHDKLEGLAILDGGNRLVIANDSDFGINSTSPPSYAIAPKTIPSTGEPDYSEVLVVDLTKLPAATSTATVTLTVGDTTAPTISCPLGVTVLANTPSGRVVTYPAPTATDNCGATVTCSPASGSFFAIGTTSVTCTARDAANNATSCSFAVTVQRPQFGLCAVDDVTGDYYKAVTTGAPGSPGYGYWELHVVNGPGSGDDVILFGVANQVTSTRIATTLRDTDDPAVSMYASFSRPSGAARVTATDYATGRVYTITDANYFNSGCP